MRIMTTGANGFIGRHLTNELSAMNHDVIATGSMHGDLRHPDVSRRLISESLPDAVVHLAAKTGRLFGEDDPEQTLTCNTLTTLNIAKACAENDVRLVYISTSEAFGDHGSRDVKDGDADVLPSNIYGLSKRWGEEAARLYAPKGLQILRLSMPYGPGLPAGRGRAALITFLWNALKREPLTVHRHAKRCWCWVGDTVAAMRMIMEGSDVGVWTIGRDDNEVSMEWVARYCCQITGAPDSLIRMMDAPVNQTLIKRLPTERVRALGWAPTVDIEQGIKLTLDAVRNYDENGMPPDWSAHPWPLKNTA